MNVIETRNIATNKESRKLLENMQNMSDKQKENMILTKVDNSNWYQGVRDLLGISDELELNDYDDELHISDDEDDNDFNQDLKRIIKSKSLRDLNIDELKEDIDDKNQKQKWWLMKSGKRNNVINGLLHNKIQTKRLYQLGMFSF